MYLVAVLDVYARYVVSWALDDTLEQPFVLDAVGQALTHATPRIWNSDQGSHFTSPHYTRLLEEAGVQMRRVYLIKPNGKKRPLGIPTMTDRAMQALYLLALEPVAETTGDPNSYGFRPKRSTADAIGHYIKSLAFQGALNGS